MTAGDGTSPSMAVSLGRPCPASKRRHHFLPGLGRTAWHRPVPFRVVPGRTGQLISPLRDHTPRVPHVIQLALGPFVSRVGVRGHTKSCQAHEHNQRLGENDSTQIGNSERHCKELNARINNLTAIRAGLAKITEKVCIST
jgi:hypothetical protein